MSVCPGCGRCRECGQRTTPTPVYPWYGPQPYAPPAQPLWINPMPPTWFSPTAAPTFTWTVGPNTGTAI